MPAMKVSKTQVPKPQYKKVGAKKASGIKGRSTLQYGKQTRSAAKQKATKIAKGQIGRKSAEGIKGEELLKGVEGMARRTNLDEETYSRIQNMQPEKLAQMYANDELIFDVFFDYGGISENEYGAYEVDPDKLQDFDFLIEQYNKLFPEAAV